MMSKQVAVHHHVKWRLQLVVSAPRLSRRHQAMAHAADSACDRVRERQDAIPRVDQIPDHHGGLVLEHVISVDGAGKVQT